VRYRWDLGCPCHHPGALHSPACRIPALPQVDLPAQLTVPA